MHAGGQACAATIAWQACAATGLARGPQIAMDAQPRMLGRGAQCKVLACTWLGTTVQVTKRGKGLTVQHGSEIAVKCPFAASDTDVSPSDTPRKLLWESQILERIRDRSLPNLMHYIDFDPQRIQLCLPRMHGGTVNEYFTPKKDHRRHPRYLDYGNPEQGKLLHKLVCCVLTATFRGLDALHGMGCAHRDLKMDNLLLRHEPSSSEFGIESVVLCDFGYSICDGINTDEARRDFPGTLPYTAPEVLGARTLRRKAVTRVLDSMITFATDRPGAVALLSELEGIKKKLQRMKKDPHKLSDNTALDRARDAAQCDGEAVRAFQEASRVHMGEINQLMASANRKAADIYSSAILIWMLCHDQNAFPFPKLQHGGESGWETKLKTMRPELSSRSVPACLSRLFRRMVDENVLESAWKTEPEDRPSAKQLLDSVMQIIGRVPWVDGPVRVM